jgi:hypothetical protein
MGTSRWKTRLGDRAFQNNEKQPGLVFTALAPHNLSHVRSSESGPILHSRLLQVPIWNVSRSGNDKRARLCEYHVRLDSTHLLEMHENNITTANGSE